MTDEAATMPASILRELVLRLVCPEVMPPIRATSDTSYREQEVVARFKSPAARKLSRSQEAIDFMYRFNASVELIDEIVGLFLDAADAPQLGGHLLSKRTRASGVFEEVLYAYKVTMLGGSRPVMDRLLPFLTAGGWWRQAEEIAAKLDRQLTRDEVLDLVRSYTEGAIQSSQSDQFWPDFARRHLGAEGANLARRWIAERDERWANDLY